MLGSVKTFQSRLLRWYAAHHRQLPWRVVGRDAHKLLDPYRVLVSEAMLQQTQVATVIPYYHRFLERFPTLQSLAEADLQDVLRLWQGLGYYSRARNLQRAAKEIVVGFNGRVPSTLQDLLSLPGVGRYTAGAVASIAHNQRAPILDGNVARVLCRVDGVQSDPREKATTARLWSRAEELLPHTRVGDFNSALMELGATVCTPRSPKCPACPVRAHCRAKAANLQEQIPPVRQTRETPLERRITLCLHKNGRWLIEQRPSTGRWAGMWQFLTVPTPFRSDISGDKALSRKQVRDLTGFDAGPARSLGRVTHSLTHRRYEFYVFTCETTVIPPNLNMASRAWANLCEMDRYALPRPHVTIAALLDPD